MLTDLVDEQEQNDSTVLLGVLHEAIESALTPTERKVMILHYGLDGQGEHPLREVSRIVSGNSTSNIATGMYRRAIPKLRRHMDQRIS